MIIFFLDEKHLRQIKYKHDNVCVKQTTKKKKNKTNNNKKLLVAVKNNKNKKLTAVTTTLRGTQHIMSHLSNRGAGKQAFVLEQTSECM